MFRTKCVLIEAEEPNAPNKRPQPVYGEAITQISLEPFWVNNTSMDPYDLIREGKIKRYFRAKRKLNVPQVVFHITQRAAGKEPLFIEDSDYIFMLWLLKEIASNYALRIYAFCLMPNHVHLLLSTREENLYDAMRDLFSRYVMKVNRKYERKGHLCGGPYRQAVCLDDSYLLAASLYIHLNPVKAGLTVDPLSYPWSSCKLYCQDRSGRSFVDSNFVLSILPQGSARKQNYKSLLQKGVELEMEHVLEQRNAIERFRTKLAALFPALFEAAAGAKRIAGLTGVDILSSEQIEKLIEDAKSSPFPGRPENRKAKKFLIEQLLARGYKQIEIGEKLGISRKTVYNILTSTE
jgi:putative transposase